MADNYDVVVADYPSLATAERDFEALLHQIAHHSVGSEGAILVEHDDDGRLRVARAGDHRGRAGHTWDGGVGLVVGLVSPPLLASVVMGRDVGGVVARFTRHKTDSGIEKGLDGRFAPGTAAIVALVDDEDLVVAQQALAGSPAELVLPVDATTIEELRSALAEAVG